MADLSLPARQVVEICRAIAAEARVVLMDEPTSSLQGEDVQRLFALIRRLRERGLTVVYISHFLEEVRQIADRFTVLRDGRNVATGLLAATTDAELITHMVGRSIEHLFPPRGAAPRGRARARGGRAVEPARAARRLVRAAAGRGPGHRRPHGLGPHRARALAVRPRSRRAAGRLRSGRPDVCRRRGARRGRGSARGSAT